MSRVRSLRALAPETCPQCGQTDQFVITREKIECRHCGYVFRDDANKPIKPPTLQGVAAPPGQPRDIPPMVEREPLRPEHGVTRTRDVEPYVMAAYNTAMAHVHREDWEGAIKALERCVDYRRDFVEAHWWLGRLLPDIDARIEHIQSVLAYEPMHGAAARELMILRGELSLDEVQSLTEHTMPEVRHAGAAVQLDTENLRCPRCNASNITHEEGAEYWVCGTCGYRQDGVQSGSASDQSLLKALIKRRSQPTQWVVGERLLYCQTCGAKRTIPATKLSGVCPFCGSKHVATTDALGTFQQPDSIVPFLISEERARERIDERLSGRMERLKGWFTNNQVERVDGQGVYLPFWVFDANLHVSRTIIDQRNAEATFKPVVPYTREQYPEMMNNLLVPGFDSLSSKKINGLGKFNLKKAMPYQPKLLAQHAAELYEIDFDRAALDAREMASRAMRDKYGRLTGNNEVRINVFTTVNQMTFRLMLLPIWSFTLTEQDGDYRTALVNGQTGQVVLGRARKPQI